MWSAVAVCILLTIFVRSDSTGYYSFQFPADRGHCSRAAAAIQGWAFIGNIDRYENEMGNDRELNCKL